MFSLREELEEPMCSYCGINCCGDCDDPDVCPSCWLHPLAFNEPEILADTIEDCIEKRCICLCHADYFEEEGCMFEAGVFKTPEVHGPPYVREGVFPFLDLPAEIRGWTYGYAFLQDGNQRISSSHRGYIHTALLGTCRQVYQEARRLPLTRNELCFASPIHAHHFLGFLLAPEQRTLVTGMRIEFDVGDFSGSIWPLLLKELAKMPITHLGLTVKGRFKKEVLTGYACITNRFKVLKGLESFDIILACGLISKRNKRDLQETMRETLIKDYVRPKELQMSEMKRTASVENPDGSARPAKKVMKGNATTKYQNVLVTSPKTGRLGLKSLEAERKAARAAEERAKQRLLELYHQLEKFAKSLDPDAAPVKIRLRQAHEAAEAADETKFEKLAYEIFLTLEDRYDKVVAARSSMTGIWSFLVAYEPTDTI